MFATKTGKTRAVDQGMRCPGCGVVFQVHVSGRDRGYIEEPVRRFYPQYSGYATRCVFASGNGPGLYVRDFATGHATSISTGWKELVYFWQDQARAAITPIPPHASH